MGLSQPDIRYIVFNMSKFFKHAPVQDTFQKRLLDAVRESRHTLASLPWGEPLVGIYAQTALLAPGMAVVVCLDRFAVERNLDLLGRVGLSFPEVAVYETGVDLDGLHRQLNRGRVKLLLTTPAHFATLNFLDLLVHHPLSFVGVEEADRLLPYMPGHGALEPLREGLALLRRLPPLVPMVPPMAPVRLRELARLLHLPAFQLIQTPPDWSRIRVSVRFLVNERQKFRALMHELSRRSREAESGPVLVQVGHPAEAEKLANALERAGVEPVWTVSDRQDSREVAAIAQMVRHRPRSVIVSAGVDFRHLQPDAFQHLRLIGWSTPAGLDELLASATRHAREPGSGITETLMLHVRDDYNMALDRLYAERQAGSTTLEERGGALQHYRRWLFSEACRLQTLVAYYQGTSSVSVPPCGGCDRCLPNEATWLQKTLKHWLY